MRNPAAQGLPDANQSQVVTWYEELFCLVYDCHKLGGGFPDLMVRIPTAAGQVLQLVEVKTPDGSLRPSQQTFIGIWGHGCVAVVACREDVVAHVERVRNKYRGMR